MEGVDDAAPECPILASHVGIGAELAEEIGERAPALLSLLGTFRPLLPEQGVMDGLPFGGAFFQPG